MPGVEEGLNPAEVEVQLRAILADVKRTNILSSVAAITALGFGQRTAVILVMGMLEGKPL